MKLSDEQILTMNMPKGAGWFLDEHSDSKIKSKDFGIISEGCNDHARQLTTHVFKDESLFYEWFENSKLHAECDVPVILGMFYKNRVQRNMHLRYAGIDTRSTVLDQAPAIIWWVGTDVMNLETQYASGDSRYIEKLNHPNIIHLVESTATKEELSPYLDEMTILPLPAPVEYKPMPIPPSKKVAVYMPPGRKDFYGYNIIREVANELPKVTFIFYANQAVEADIAQPIDETTNCWDFGVLNRDDMTRLIADSTVCLRITEHDGVPLSILEFGMAGRQIIFNHQHIMPVNNYFEFDRDGNFKIEVERLAELVWKCVNVKEPDTQLSEKYYERYGHKRFLKKFKDIIARAKGRI